MRMVESRKAQPVSLYFHLLNAVRCSIVQGCDEKQLLSSRSGDKIGSLLVEVAGIFWPELVF
jgi:hypothetical protein